MQYDCRLILYAAAVVVLHRCSPHNRHRQIPICCHGHLVRGVQLGGRAGAPPSRPTGLALPVTAALQVLGVVQRLLPDDSATWQNMLIKPTQRLMKSSASPPSPPLTLQPLSSHAIVYLPVRCSSFALHRYPLFFASLAEDCVVVNRCRRYVLRQYVAGLFSAFAATTLPHSRPLPPFVSSSCRWSPRPLPSFQHPLTVTDRGRS